MSGARPALVAALIAGLAGASAAADSGGGVDLLAGPLEAQGGWRHVSEAAGTELGDVWTLTSGVLVCRGMPRGYLYWSDEPADFTLSLEWRRPAGAKPGKAGVLVRTTGPDRIWPRSLEAQLNAGQAGDFWGLGGFALDGPAERKKTVDHPEQGRLTNLARTADPERPQGGWNLYEIEARGPVVTLRINGVEVNRATGCDTNAGRICLTAEGDPIEFRNVRLRVADDGHDFTRLIPPVLPTTAVFRQEGWCLWDPCVVRGDDGLLHLFYSRWPAALGFDAWCTHAEIARATATNAAGPYEFRGVALPSRGAEFWDGHSVYNTCVVRDGSRFLLYYTGNRGTADWAPDRRIPGSSEAWWTQRNRQRIGVAVADHPGGPWTRLDKPLIDVGPGFGQGIVAVPNVVAKPGGGFRLYYKTLAEGPGRFGGGVFHYGADSESPLGPFARHPEPMVDKNRLLGDAGRHFNFHIDDHFEWVQDGRWYAIVKDHDAPFLTPHGRSLLLFESGDGRSWRPSRHALVKDFAITWDDGSRQDFERLEMPKLLIEDGRPKLLSLAAKPPGVQESFLIVVPLAGAQEK
jgi:hypothetical protein